MDTTLAKSRDTFILGMSRISNFWGFPKAMGAIYGAIYLSPQPISLDDLVDQVNVTKGAVSTNVRALERLGMVHKIDRIGERKDYYDAETDFWKIVKGILREREKNELDRALGSVNASLELIENGEIESSQAELAGFYQERMRSMQVFFHSLDRFVAIALGLENLRFITVQKLIGKIMDGNGQNDS